MKQSKTFILSVFIILLYLVVIKPVSKGTTATDKENKLNVNDKVTVRG